MEKNVYTTMYANEYSKGGIGYQSMQLKRRNNKNRMKLHVYKKANKLTLEKVSSLTSINKSTLSKFLNGNNVTERTLLKIEQLF